MEATQRKVLIIVENLPVPFDSRVWKEACSLRDGGYRVTVLCPRGKGYRKNYELLEGIHIYRHPMPKEGNNAFGYIREYGVALFWEFLYTCWIWLRHGFHVIQGCNPPDDIVFVALPFKLFGVKYIFDHHDANPELYLSKYERQGALYKIQVWMEKVTYRFSDVVMATNGSYKDLAVTRGGLDPEDVFVVRNGPDLKTFRPVAPVPALKYGKTYLVGYVGTMSIQEGLDILIDVALHIRTLGRNDVHFTCVGGGPGLPVLRQMVREKSLESTFNFTGRIPDKDLLDILSTADVCVNPDKPCEMNDISTMIKIMEYMALAKPIVQFDLKEGKFSAQDASLYADSKNQINDFAAGILWLLEHPEERQRMGVYGYKRVQEKLAWEYSVPNLLAAYSRVFERDRPRRGNWHQAVRPFEWPGSSGLTKVWTIDPLQDHRWRDLIATHPGATVFHTPEWLQALSRTYSYKPVALTTAGPGESLEDGLVFCRVTSRLTGQRNVSLPFSDHCEPLSRSEHTLRQLLFGGGQDLTSGHARYMEVRPVSSIKGAGPEWKETGSFCTHRLDLRPPAGKIFEGFHKDCVQRKIRRARREGLQCEEGRTDRLLADFYHLLVLTRKRQRLIPQPLVWFRTLVASMGDMLTIRAAYKDGRPVAAILTLRFRDTLVYKYGCSDTVYNNLGGTQLLFWNAIQEAKERGLSDLDLGRSDWDNPGLITFKDRWGAARSELSYWRLDAGYSRFGHASWLLKAMSPVLAHIPEALLPITGRVIYRHLA